MAIMRSNKLQVSSLLDLQSYNQVCTHSILDVESQLRN